MMPNRENPAGHPANRRWRGRAADGASAAFRSRSYRPAHARTAFEVMPPMSFVLNCLIEEHDWRLVALAAAVCLLASWVTIGLFYRARASRGRARLVWLCLDAAAGGCGIWATHFISMLAYAPGADEEYNIALTALSLLIAVAIAGIGLTTALSGSSTRSAAIGGAIVGGGIAAMHFTGMLALELPGDVGWSPGLASIAVAFGGIFASLAFVAAARHDDFRHVSAATALLGAAIILLHFTAMAAVTFTPDPARVVGAASLSPAALALIVAGVAAFILGMCVVAALGDRRSEDRLQRQKLLLDAALQNLSLGVCVFDAAGRVTLFNELFAGMMGFSSQALEGRSLLDLLKQRQQAGDFTGDPDEVFARVRNGAREKKSVTRSMVSPYGRNLHVLEQPMPGGGWISTLEDVTERKRAEADILRLARRDALTGLANRMVFTEKLAEASKLHARQGGGFTVIMLDLDRFKAVNDTLGHPAGDQLLVEVGKRLRSSIREVDVLARLGGDEFAIIALGVPNQREAAASLALRIIEIISGPFDLNGHRACIGTSIGIALAPEHGVDADDLLKKADIALYSAKESGRNAYRLYRDEMLEAIQAQQAAENELRDAIAHNEFELHYQPVMSVAALQIRAFEALVRWRHPSRGLIGPDDFIELAESTGLIMPLGNWILRQACADAVAWPSHIRLAVNISAIQFRKGDVFNTVLEVLNQTGLSPTRLELEITETSLLENEASNLAAIRQLKNIGVSIALDDFGKGYSSIHYLVNFPFDKIKIDRSFTQGCLSRPECRAVISSVLALTNGLDILTTAEGVETAEQLDYLRAAGVDFVQGFLFAEPVPIAELDLEAAGVPAETSQRTDAA
jgi:diguanylate cyclase (GGDEF)-like protein/PAS domain S-box-containing protein